MIATEWWKEQTPDTLYGTRYRLGHEGVKQFTEEEVAFHDTIENCWVIYMDKVYDITEVMMNRDETVRLIMKAGRDITDLWGTTPEDIEKIKPFYVGDLVEHTQKYRRTDLSRWIMY